MRAVFYIAKKAILGITNCGAEKSELLAYLGLPQLPTVCFMLHHSIFGTSVMECDETKEWLTALCISCSS